jgi:3D-(3,5/4)-trihydroxycyclohexane-1,2-dione acylhydrolase (decyclizing)
MTVGGSKGSSSGNYAMSRADALLVVGSRAVCQSDCSRTGYPKVRRVVNINTDPEAALHYADTTALLGDAKPTLQQLIRTVRELRAASPAETQSADATASDWLVSCQAARRRWEDFKDLRYANPVAYDDIWRREVLTQPGRFIPC